MASGNGAAISVKESCFLENEIVTAELWRWGNDLDNRGGRKGSCNHYIIHLQSHEPLYSSTLFWNSPEWGQFKPRQPALGVMTMRCTSFHYLVEQNSAPPPLQYSCLPKLRPDHHKTFHVPRHLSKLLHNKFQSRMVYSFQPHNKLSIACLYISCLCTCSKWQNYRL